MNGNYYSILGRYRGCIGIMGKKMETTIIGMRLGLCKGAMIMRSTEAAINGRTMPPARALCKFSTFLIM